MVQLGVEAVPANEKAAVSLRMQKAEMKSVVKSIGRVVFELDRQT